MADSKNGSGEVVTRDELTTEARRLIVSAKASLELSREFEPVFMTHLPSGRWKVLKIEGNLGRFLNDGNAKRVFFDAIRYANKRAHADACIIATDSWYAKATPEGEKHIPTGEYRREIDAGFAKLLELGWATRQEAIQITAQTEADVLLITQAYQRLDGGKIQMLKAETRWFPQADFAGRLKMFGDLRKETLGEHPATA
jgi:hypothetical protein